MFSEFEEIQMKDSKVSEYTISALNYSRYIEATFKVWKDM